MGECVGMQSLGAYAILNAMIQNYKDGFLALESIELPEFALAVAEREKLDPIVAVDLRAETVNAIAQYLLDLYRSNKSDPIYRSKIMVVGNAEVGKTSLLGCLFPLEATEAKFEQEKPKAPKKSKDIEDWTFEEVGTWIKGLDIDSSPMVKEKVDGKTLSKVSDLI